MTDNTYVNSYDSARNADLALRAIPPHPPAQEMLNWVFNEGNREDDLSVTRGRTKYYLKSRNRNHTAYKLAIAEVLGIPLSAMSKNEDGVLTISGKKLDDSLTAVETRLVGKTQEFIHSEIERSLEKRTDALAEFLCDLTGVDWIRNSDTQIGLHYTPALPVLNVEIAQKEIQHLLDTFDTGLQLAPRGTVKETAMRISLPAPENGKDVWDTIEPIYNRIIKKSAVLFNIEAIDAARAADEDLHGKYLTLDLMPDSAKKQADLKSLEEQTNAARIKLEQEEAKAFTLAKPDIKTRAPILDVLGEMSQKILGTEALWSYDKQKNEFILPYNHSPRTDVSDEYNVLISQCRSYAINRFKEMFNEPSKEYSAAGNLVQSDNELRIKNPNIEAIEALAEHAPTIRLRLSPDDTMILANALKFETTNQQLSNGFGKWEFFTVPDTEEREVRIKIKLPSTTDNFSEELTQMAEDLNFSARTSGLSAARFDNTSYTKHKPYMTISEISPLLFDERLEAMRDAIKTWVKVAENRVAENRKPIADATPATRPPKASDVQLLQQLNLKQSFPPVVSINSENSNDFEYHQKQDGSTVLRLPIFTSNPRIAKALVDALVQVINNESQGLLNADISILANKTSHSSEKMLSSDTQNVLSAMRANASASEEKSNFREPKNISSDSQEVFAAMYKASDLGIADKASGKKSINALKFPAKIYALEITAIALDTAALQQEMPYIVKGIKKVAERLKSTLKLNIPSSAQTQR